MKEKRMSFSTKNYRISFVWQGRSLYENVMAYSFAEAINIVQQRYPGATSFGWQELS
jgi:hypothetical protein